MYLQLLIVDPASRKTWVNDMCINLRMGGGCCALAPDSVNVQCAVCGGFPRSREVAEVDNINYVRPDALGSVI